MKHLTLVSALLFLFCSCETAVSPNKEPLANNNPPVPNDVTLDSQSNKISDKKQRFYDLRQTIGVLRTTNESVRTGGANFYNKDGSLWYRFRFAGDPNDARSDSNVDFQPFRFSTDGYIVLNLVKKNENFFEVVVNEKTGELKYAKGDDPSFEGFTWERYILDCFAVEFDEGENPMRSEPVGTGIELQFPSGSRTFHPVEINGDWLEVKWFENDDTTRKSNTGWIRWKDGNSLLIMLFETA